MPATVVRRTVIQAKEVRARAKTGVTVNPMIAREAMLECFVTLHGETLERGAQPMGKCRDAPTVQDLKEAKVRRAWPSDFDGDGGIQISAGRSPACRSAAENDGLRLLAGSGCVSVGDRRQVSSAQCPCGRSAPAWRARSLARKPHCLAGLGPRKSLEYLGYRVVLGRTDIFRLEHAQGLACPKSKTQYM